MTQKEIAFLKKIFRENPAALTTAADETVKCLIIGDTTSIAMAVTSDATLRREIANMIASDITKAIMREKYMTQSGSTIH